MGRCAVAVSGRGVEVVLRAVVGGRVGVGAWSSQHPIRIRSSSPLPGAPDLFRRVASCAGVPSVGASSCREGPEGPGKTARPHAPPLAHARSAALPKGGRRLWIVGSARVVEISCAGQRAIVTPCFKRRMRGSSGPPPDGCGERRIGSGQGFVSKVHVCSVGRLSARLPGITGGKQIWRSTGVEIGAHLRDSGGSSKYRDRSVVSSIL